MAWFKRKRGTREVKRKAALDVVNDVLEIFSQEKETQLNISTFFVQKEKAEMYAKKLDKLLGVRGVPDSGGTSEWIQWVKGKLSVTVFIKEE